MDIQVYLSFKSSLLSSRLSLTILKSFCKHSWTYSHRYRWLPIWNHRWPSINGCSYWFIFKMRSISISHPFPHSLTTLNTHSLISSLTRYLLNDWLNHKVTLSCRIGHLINVVVTFIRMSLISRLDCWSSEFSFFNSMSIRMYIFMQGN